MTDLAFSKQIKERHKFFPWLKLFQRKLLKHLTNDFDFNTLQFFLQNVEEEITTLPRNAKSKRKEALFEIVYELFFHFWWRIRFKDRKKWSRYWKKVSTDISYTKDEHSQCCEKLLYYIIRLGITFSQGRSDSEWIEKILQAIHILPSFDSMVYNALLQVNKLPKKFKRTYCAILKHVLCSGIAMNVTEPAVYIKIMLLFRRLKKCTDVEFTISTIESTISRIKPPSDIMQWMSSQALDFPLEKHESFGKKLLNIKSNYLFHKLYHVVTTPFELEETTAVSTKDDTTVTTFVEEKTHIQPSQKERIEMQHHKAKIKKCKHKMVSHSKLKLRDSQLNLSVDGTSVCLDSPVHLEVSTSSDCKMHANTTITIKSKKHKNFKKKLCTKTQDILGKSVHGDTRVIGTSAMNEFLNFSFSEISNFSRKLESQKQNNQQVSEGNNGIKNNYISKNVPANSNEECDQAKSCNGPSSCKKVKLDSNDKICKENQSIQKSNLQQSVEANSLVTFSSNEPKDSPLNTPENLMHTCTNETSEVDQIFSIYSPHCHSPSSSNLLYTKTSVSQNSSSQIQAKQASPEKIQFIPSVDIQKSHPSALLKLVQLPYEDVTSRHCETFTNSDNQPNTGNPSSMTCSASILRAPKRLKALCGMPPKIFPEYNTTEIDAIKDKPVCSTELVDDTYLSKNGNENTCNDGEHLDSSIDLCNNLNNCSSWVQNKSNSSFVNDLFDDHRWGQSQPLIPTIYRSLEPSQNCLVNSPKSSIGNTEATYGNGFVTPRPENELSGVTVSQNDTSSNCVFDCNIISDPNKSVNESITSFKVVINVSCKVPEDTPNQQSEHIFGNFNNASENYFDSSLNLFSIPSPQMPKLTPFYDDPPIGIAMSSLNTMEAVDAFGTPPDSELETSIPASSSRQGEVEDFSNTFFENHQNKSNFSSTPNEARNKIPRKTSKDDSDFRTPQTSDCESFSEYNVENINMTKYPVTHFSTMKSPVDDILERLNYRIHLRSDKSESSIATTAHKENVSYRSVTDGYSNDELSEDATTSILGRESTTDDELDENFSGQKVCTDDDDAPFIFSITGETNIETSDISKQVPLKVFKKRKNYYPKKISGSDQSIIEFQEESAGTSSCSYSLRPRTKLKRPSILEDFFYT